MSGQNRGGLTTDKGFQLLFCDIMPLSKSSSLIFLCHRREGALSRVAELINSIEITIAIEIFGNIAIAIVKRFPNYYYCY